MNVEYERNIIDNVRVPVNLGDNNVMVDFTDFKIFILIAQC